MNNLFISIAPQERLCLYHSLCKNYISHDECAECVVRNPVKENIFIANFELPRKEYGFWILLEKISKTSSASFLLYQMSFGKANNVGSLSFKFLICQCLKSQLVGRYCAISLLDLILNYLALAPNH